MPGVLLECSGCFCLGAEELLPLVCSPCCAEVMGQQVCLECVKGHLNVPVVVLYWRG